MLKKRDMPLVVLFFLLIVPLASAFNASTSSYTADSFHLGSVGSNGSTASYEFRSTTTYQQPSSNQSTTSSYSFISGWYKAATQEEEEGGSQQPSSGGGGGGCTEKWDCTDWSSCVNGTQTRTCTDANKCKTTKNKPNETQSCIIGGEEVPEEEVEEKPEEKEKQEGTEVQKRKTTWIPIVLSAFAVVALIIFVIFRLHPAEVIGRLRPIEIIRRFRPIEQIRESYLAGLIRRSYPAELIRRLHFKVKFSHHPAKLVVSGKK
jgi:hypothetical protein